MEERTIGRVTHFFGRAGVAVLDLTETLRIGDTVHIRGRTTDLAQRVESLQIEHESVQEAGPGDSVALKVAGRVRPGDVLYREEQ